MNTGQTVYEQLQDIVVGCSKWIPRGNKSLVFDTIFCSEEGFMIINDYTGECNTYSYHDLFSIESGIMERVEWEDKNLPNWYYITMCGMTGEEKVKRFVNNAIIPTK